LREAIRQISKLDLHFHFRGGIPAGLMWRLAKKYHPGIEFGQFRAMFDITDFKSFWRAYDFLTGLVRTEDDLGLAARAVARRLARDNVIYSEVSITPFAFKGIAPHRVLETISSAFRQAGIDMVFIGPFERHDTLLAAAYKYEFYLDARSLGVHGIGLAGDEASNPVPEFAGVFEKAKSDGFGITVHAGEYRDERNVAYAVRRLFADRIGHGNNIRDSKTIDEILDRNIHIEMCPLSNMRLNRQITPENYDLPRYYRNGISVNINSDDPGIVGSFLGDNYEFAAEKFSFGRKEFDAMSEDSALASFAPRATKLALVQKLREHTQTR
jgi:aminodeoxyfutalosine deaminase